MLVQAVSQPETVTTVNTNDGGVWPLSRSDQALLSVADAGAESHVVLFVPGALDLACALFRQGVGEVTIVRVGDRYPAAKADVAIVPDVRSAEYLEHVISGSRRMLMPLSTVVIRIEYDLIDALLLSARRQLVLHGFTAIRSWTADGDVVLRAELPLCGRPTCA